MITAFKCHKPLGQFVKSQISNGKSINGENLIQMTMFTFPESS